MKLLVTGKACRYCGPLLTKTLLIMKLTACLILFAALHAAAKTNAQKITIREKNISLAKIFELINDQTGYAFVYDDHILKGAKPISLEVRDMPLELVLEHCFKDQPFTYEIKHKTIIVKEQVLKKIPGVLQNAPPHPLPPHTIRGKVTDEKGAPVEGASIVLKPGSKGTASDANGDFVISNVEQGSYTITVSYVGYSVYEKNVVISGADISLAVALQSMVNALSETIVVGYGTVKKSDLTGAVSSVSSGKITQVNAVSNIAQALQGMAAGVQVNQSSGQPGEAVIIKIRGTNSINGGNAPLYVVDGLPLDGLSAQLNPDDIDRIEVLKDASSTAIYGSRGANGVIMITTKKGREGKATIAYNGYAGVQMLRKKTALVNAQEFAQLQNEVITNYNTDNPTDLRDLPWTQQQIDSLAGKGSDWQDLVYNNAFVQNHDIAVSGGNASTKFYTSLGYYDQDGIITNSNFKRLSFRGNLNQVITKRLTINTNFSVQNSVYRQAVYSGADGGGGIPFTTMVMPPIQGVYDAAGNYTKFTGVPWGETNPVGISKELYNPSSNLRIIGNAGIVYEILSGLNLKLNAGVDAGFNKSDYYAPSAISIGQPGGRASKNYSNSATFVTEDLITYTKKYSKHGIDALAGITYQYTRSENLNSGTGVGFITDVFQNNNISAATTAAIPSTGFGDSKLVSYLGRLNYNFDGRYFVTFTGRYDGSSRFAEDKKFAFFPSGAVAWRISEENFMKAISFISNLKLRASYGLSGNQAISNYQTLARLSNVNPIFDNAINIAYVQGSLAYKNLKWETTGQLDIGFDAGFFKERVQVTFDYYNKKTEDLLLNVSLPTSSGFGSVLQNFGTVQNRGYEIQLATVNTKGAVKWTSVLNFSHNTTKVLRLENDAAGNPVTYKELGTGGNWFPTIVGQSMGQLYGYTVSGIYQTDEEAVKNGEPTKHAGDYKFWDKDGNGVVDGNDRSVLTRLEPKFTFGFNNHISFKGFDLSLLFVGSYGNDIVNEFRKYNITMNGNWAPTREAFEQRWTGPGSGNMIDRPSVTSGSSIRDYANSLWVEDGSYIKLRDISLGYSLPSSVLKSIHIAAIKIYVSAQNFITLTGYSGYDPEVSWSAASVNGWDRGNYPSMKSVTAGLKVTF